MKKRSNPSDLTLRNLRAMAKRLATMQAKLIGQDALIRLLSKRMQRAEAKIAMVWKIR